MSTHAALPANKHSLPLAVKLLGSMLFVILLAVGFARWQGVMSKQADAATVWQRDLIFADGPNGSVVVKDALSQSEIAQFDGEQGFLRSTLRALVRERKRQNIGPDAPMQLLGRADGRLTLIDPSTQQRIDLEAFGPGNAAVFAGLQTAGLATQQNIQILENNRSSR